MIPLPLTRGAGGRLHFAGCGAVTLRIDRGDILCKGGQGVVFRGRIYHGGGGGLLKQVAVKIKHRNSARDPFRDLEAEADVHARAWARLDHVLRPLGFLAADRATGTPAMLVSEIGMPFALFVTQAGPLSHRRPRWIKAITRITFELLRFIVSGYSVNLVHGDIKVWNLYVVNAEDLDLAELAVGDFGAAQLGEQKASGAVSYRAGVYHWDYTSPRMATYLYEQITSHGVKLKDLSVDRQLALYNELFRFARVAFTALVDRPPPDMLYGPSPWDTAQVPPLGLGDVADATCHLLRFALDLLTAGIIEDKVDLAYINGLDWYHSLLDVLGGSKDKTMIGAPGFCSSDTARW